MSGPVVTQADINAGVALKYALDDLGSTSWSVRAATPEEHPVPQAFARHRVDSVADAIADKDAQIALATEALRAVVGYSTPNGMTRVRMRAIAKAALAKIEGAA